MRDRRLAEEDTQSGFFVRSIKLVSIFFADFGITSFLLYIIEDFAWLSLMGEEGVVVWLS